MMKRLGSISAVLTLLCIFSFDGLAQAPDDDGDRNAAGAVVDVTGTYDGDVRAGGAEVTVDVQAEDIWAFGGDVSVKGSAEENVAVAGANVSVDAEIEKKIWAAGGNLEFYGSAREGATLAGANIIIGADVGGKLRAAGANVLVLDGAKIKDVASLAGANVIVDGELAGDLEVAAQSITISGTIDGSVNARGSDLRILRDSVIRGNVDFEGKTAPTVEDGAVINGELSFEQSDAPGGFFGMGADNQQSNADFAVLAALGSFVSGIILFLVFSPFMEKTIANYRHNTWSCLFAGLAILILLPFAGIFFFMTVIGIPLGIITFLTYPAMLIIGYFIAGFGVSNWLLNRSDQKLSKVRRIFYYGAGLVGLAGVSFIPFIGPLVILIALILGVGALAVSIVSGGPQSRALQTVDATI